MAISVISHYIKMGIDQNFGAYSFTEAFCVSSCVLCSFLREDVAHLSLYNLSVIHKKKYFDSELELMTYINENWDRLQLGEVLVCFVYFGIAVMIN